MWLCEINSGTTDLSSATLIPPIIYSNYPRGVFIFGWIQKRTKKITAAKKMPDSAPVSLKFFKLTRLARSNSEEFPSARPALPSGRHFLRGRNDFHSNAETVRRIISQSNKDFQRRIGARSGEISSNEAKPGLQGPNLRIEQSPRAKKSARFLNPTLDCTLCFLNRSLWDRRSLDSAQQAFVRANGLNTGAFSGCWGIYFISRSARVSTTGRWRSPSVEMTSPLRNRLILH